MIQNYLSFIQAYPYAIAPFIGLIPATIWLWFWLQEDTHPEPLKMLTLSFFGGMASVILVLPLQQLVYWYTQDQNFLSFFLWASIEEVFKFGMVYFIALRYSENDEPVDSIIYLIVSALGFVALENTLFLTNIIKAGDFSGIIITGGLRFIGASLLHIISSSTIGICLALSFYKNTRSKILCALSGVSIAIILHTYFNIYIMKEIDGNVFPVFGFVWICIVALLIMFEKVKHMTATSNIIQN